MQTMELTAVFCRYVLHHSGQTGAFSRASITVSQRSAEIFDDMLAINGKMSAGGYEL